MSSPTATADTARPPEPPLDRADERLGDQGTGWHGLVGRLRSGDIGALPVVIGLVIIWTIFEILNPVFLSANNLVNLLFDSTSTGIISLGIVCVLMVGQIDLSVGSVSGLSSALLGVLWINNGMPAGLAALLALIAGLIIGGVYGYLFNRFGIPSFVATLGGLLAFLGLQLYLLGPKGSVNLPFDSTVVSIGQLYFVPPVASYVLALLTGVALFGTRFADARRRAAAGLSSKPLGTIAVQAIVLTVVLEAIAVYLYRDRGVPSMFLGFLVLVVVLNYALTRTKWGRSVAAVGGNRDAARRAGINVRRIYMSTFLLCSLLATLGGLAGAARLASASQQAGTGDVNLNAIAAAVIGGTSLFGGRGSAYSALLGMLVIQSIASGLTLLNLSSSLRFMITGAVLVIAVIVDSLARRSRAAHGTA